MDFPAQFSPPKRTGARFTAIVIGVLLGAGIACIWFALNRAPQTQIAVWYLAGILLLIPVPLLAYRIYALLQARYLLDRDGLRIRWGLRSEDISMVDIEWIRPAAEMGYKLHLPLIRWPGSLYGRRATEGLGPVEFLASEADNLLLIATRDKVYAISPDELSPFLNSFRRANEMGSLTPLSSHSTMPVAYFSRIWADTPARRLILAALLSVIALVILTSVSVSSVPLMPMGYDSSGQPLEPVPSQYLLLLPILGGIAAAFDLVYGMFLYRLTSTRIMAFFLWAAAILTSVLLMAGILAAAL